MFLFDEDILIQVLESSGGGVDVASYGRPRDGFELTSNVPYFTSGFGGKYEVIHTNVPAGVMVAVGDLDSLDMSDFDVMKQQLSVIDIYPTGHSGDFTGVSPQKSKDWFNACSRLDNEVNNQVAISHAKNLTPEGLAGRYNELVEYLSDNMHIFKNSNKGGELTPADKSERAKIVVDVLDGLSKAVRYTRLDEPAKAFQLVAEVTVSKLDKGELHLSLVEENKILILRQYRNGEKSITPLDRGMMDKTYVTRDGEPLGERGQIDIGDIMQRCEEIELAIEAAKQPQPAERPDFLRQILAGGKTGGGPSLP